MSRTVLGILGTAKNTGKTTTTTALLRLAGQTSLAVGLTSIGYDGEDLDNITGLPKPRISVKKGTIVATAERCRAAGTASIQPILQTDCQTPLGGIVIGRVESEGLVVLAGPNKGRDLRAVVRELRRLSCRLVFVDGALNRIVPLMQADALVLATGASRNTSTDFLAREVQSICRLFSTPRAGEAELAEDEAKSRVTLLCGEGGSRLSTGSLVSDQDVASVLQGLHPGIRSVYIPGIVKESALARMVREGEKALAGRSVVLHDPANLLIASDPLSLFQLMERMDGAGIGLRLVSSVPILAVTVNPFYPLYNRYGDGKYEMAWVSREELYHRVKQAVGVPVIDIVHEGSGQLFELLSKEFAL
jgi:hypothetical protein